VSAVATPAKVTLAGKAAVCIGAIRLVVTIVNALQALVDLGTEESRASVARDTGAIVVTECVLAGGVDVAEVDFFKAFVDVSAVAVSSVAAETIIAGTIVASREVGTLGIRITSTMVGGAFVNVSTVEPVALVAVIACAVEARHEVCAEPVDVTSVNVFGAFIDVGTIAKCSVASKAVETGAEVRAVSVCTIRICITSTEIGITLVDVGTVDS
jgi:hypothetical protein